MEGRSCSGVLYPYMNEYSDRVRHIFCGTAIHDTGVLSELHIYLDRHRSYLRPPRHPIDKNSFPDAHDAQLLRKLFGCRIGAMVAEIGPL